MPKIKDNRPILNFSEIINEISKRNVVPAYIVKKVLQSYAQIVEEALIEGVEVPFGRIGDFTWKVYTQKLIPKSFNKDEVERIEYKNIFFRPHNTWLSELKKATITPIFKEQEKEDKNGVGKQYTKR